MPPDTVGIGHIQPAIEAFGVAVAIGGGIAQFAASRQFGRWCGDRGVRYWRRDDQGRRALGRGGNRLGESLLRHRCGLFRILVLVFVLRTGRRGQRLATPAGDIPVYNSVREGLDAGHSFNTGVVYLPPAAVRDGVAELVRGHCRAARAFAERAAGLPGVRLLNRVALNQVALDLGDRAQAICNRLNRAGFFLRTADWRGRTILRISFCGAGDPDALGDDLADALTKATSGSPRPMASAAEAEA